MRLAFRFWLPFAIGGFLALAAVAGSIIWLSSQSLREEPLGLVVDLEPAESAFRPTEIHLRRLTSLETFSRQYLESNGGKANFDQIATARTVGTLEMDDQRIPFVSIRRRPNQGLLTLKMDHGNLTFGIDGATVWRRVTRPDGSEEVMVEEGQAADELRHLADFYDPVMRLVYLKEGTLQSLSVVVYEDEPMIEISLLRADNALPVRALVDPATMQQRVRFEELADGRMQKSVFSDFRRVGKVQEAFGVVNYIDGEFLNRLVIQRSDHNVGAPSFTFRNPQESGG